MQARKIPRRNRDKLANTRRIKQNVAIPFLDSYSYSYIRNNEVAANLDQKNALELFVDQLVTSQSKLWKYASHLRSF